MIGEQTAVDIHVLVHCPKTWTQRNLLRRHFHKSSSVVKVCQSQTYAAHLWRRNEGKIQKVSHQSLTVALYSVNG